MNLRFSPTASEQFDHIIQYLEKRWSLKVSNNFVDKVFLNADLIIERPYSFPQAKNYPGLRKCVVTPQTIAYYRIKESENEIEIIAIIDSRQDF